MSISCGLAIDRPPQIERLNDSLRSQLEMGAYDIRNNRRVNLARAERIHQYAYGIGHANGVCELNFTPVRQPSRNNVLRDVTRHVRSRAVHLGRILAAESAAAMPPHATVGVHNNLAAGQPGIAHGPANHEATCGIDVILRVLVEEMSRNRSLNHVPENVATKFVIPNRLGVLRRNYDGVDAHRLVMRIVFHGHLRLSIRPQIRKLPVLTNLGKPHAKFMRKRNRRRHKLRSLITREPKHHSLVAGAAGVYAHGYFAGLFVDAGDYGAGVGVEAVEGVVVADGGNCAAHQVLEIYVGFGGDFAGDYYQAGCG